MTKIGPKIGPTFLSVPNLFSSPNGAWIDFHAPHREIESAFALSLRSRHIILIEAFVYSSLFFSIKDKTLSPYDQKQADITWSRVIETSNIEWSIVIKPLLTSDRIKLKVMLEIKEEYFPGKNPSVKKWSTKHN